MVDADGRLLRRAGDPGRLVFARSAMKPLQAAVSLSHMAANPTDQEIAVMCASHNAEPIHIEAVRTLLARAGLDEGALRCPSVRPWDDETLAAAPDRRPINSDCSGKHAGMLVACVARSWPLESYVEPDHPLQQKILATVVAASGADGVSVGVDGCGVPVHGMPLQAMAAIYASLAGDSERGPAGTEGRRAIESMHAHPYLVAGRGRVDTAVMQAAPEVVAKSGAEGLICAVLVDRGMAIAVKVRDGFSRAAGPALIRVLRVVGALGPHQLERLDEFARPPVLGGGRRVGEIEATVELEEA